MLEKSQEGEDAARVLTLDQINCEVSLEEVVRGFVPTPRFSHVSFDNYQPDPAQPTQAEAVQKLRGYVLQIHEDVKPKSGLGKLFKRNLPAAIKGIYLDGGYGVGKTHLLAATFSASPGPKAYLSFQELTYTIGAKGMAAAIEAFKPYRLICIDEFELDDPGNTMLAKTFIRGVMEGGTARIVTTSNTLPNELGHGRFAAEDFKREIGIIAASFEAVRIEGQDYRHRSYGAGILSEGVLDPTTPQLRQEFQAYQTQQGAKLYTSFDELNHHLSLHHPIRYARLLAPLDAVFIEGIVPFQEQVHALRFVHFIDKLYDQQIRLAISAYCSLPDLFLPEYRDKGYAKKYRRCLSRLHELISEGAGG
jgi:cell division protein ZapE